MGGDSWTDGVAPTCLEVTGDFVFTQQEMLSNALWSMLELIFNSPTTRMDWVSVQHGMSEMFEHSKFSQVFSLSLLGCDRTSPFALWWQLNAFLSVPQMSLVSLFCSMKVMAMIASCSRIYQMCEILSIWSSRIWTKGTIMVMNLVSSYSSNEICWKIILTLQKKLHVTHAVVWCQLHSLQCRTDVFIGMHASPG